MWLFTTHGFYSVVEDRDDPERVLVRARVREDLEALRDELLPELEITETPGADYRFRARTTKHAFARAAAALAAQIDYPNFKAAVAERQGADRARRAHIYGEVWAELLALQDDPR